MWVRIFYLSCNPSECFVYPLASWELRSFSLTRGPALVLSREIADSKPLAHTTFIRISAYVIMSRVLVQHAILFNTLNYIHGRVGELDTASAASAPGWRRVSSPSKGGRRTFNQFSDSAPLLRAFCRHATKHRSQRMVLRRRLRWHNLSRVIYNRAMIYGIWVFQRKNARAKRRRMCGTVSVGQQAPDRELLNERSSKLFLNSTRTPAFWRSYYGFIMCLRYVIVSLFSQISHVK